MIGKLRLIAALALPVHLLAQNPAGNLSGSSLEELMNIEVTSVSKKEQALSKTAAAVYVINQEDIRRSGANSVPEVLRMAPGVEVAQLDANQWAISIRGFNALFSNKVLVLIDGRAVYTSTFSGVYWDEMDVPLEDIERIEIIRGPGGTVWGANAVNGVINIITKNADDTKGGLMTAGTGSKTSAEGMVQYGGRAGSTGAYRVFGRYVNGENSLFPGGGPAADGSNRWHGGFRSDWGLTSRDTLSVQGDLQHDEAGGTANVVIAGSSPFQATINSRLIDTSADILLKWDRSLANGSTSLQVYDTSTRRDEAGARILSDVVDTEFEHHVAAGSRHDVVWGLDYRFTRDSINASGSSPIRFTPPGMSYSLFATFVQDEIQLSRSVFLTGGAKLEHNAFTGFEYEPGAQLLWAPTDKQSVWFSAARSVRQPARSDTSVIYNLAVEPIPGFGNALVRVLGSTATRAEHLKDYEAGYRAQPTRRLSLDLTGFASYYSGLQTSEPQTPFLDFTSGSPTLVLPLVFGNLAHAKNYGFEAFANLTLNSRWKLSGGYSGLRVRERPDAGSHDTTAESVSGDSPAQQFQVRTDVTLRKNLEWNSSLKYVTSLPALLVPGYVRIDTRIGWHLFESMEISLTGQNLSSGRHIEFMDSSSLYLRTEIARSVLAKASWRF